MVMTARDIDVLIDHTDDMAWLANAACAELPLADLEQFFVDAGKSISSQTVAMCQRCPARVACLDHAYRHQVASGYFGGMSPSKRRSTSHADARRAIGVPVDAERLS